MTDKHALSFIIRPEKEMRSSYCHFWIKKILIYSQSNTVLMNIWMGVWHTCKNRHYRDAWYWFHNVLPGLLDFLGICLLWLLSCHYLNSK